MVTIQVEYLLSEMLGTRSVLDFGLGILVPHFKCSLVSSMSYLFLLRQHLVCGNMCAFNFSQNFWLSLREHHDLKTRILTKNERFKKKMEVN